MRSNRFILCTVTFWPSVIKATSLLHVLTKILSNILFIYTYSYQLGWKAKIELNFASDEEMPSTICGPVSDIH